MFEGEILLVEDNAADVAMTLRSLQKHHFANKVTVVRDGAEALDYIFREGKYKGQPTTVALSLILLDLKLPKVNGLEVLKHLKSNETTRTIPVVILTSSKEEPDIREAYRLGANSYIVKPVEFDQFIEAVSNIGLYWLILNEPPVQ
jgi:two-component system response regulator